VHDRYRQRPRRDLRDAAQVLSPGPRPAAAARQLGLPPARPRLRQMADHCLRPVVLGAAPGNRNPAVPRAHPARAGPAGRCRGTRAAAQHAGRDRHRRLGEAARLTQLRLSWRGRHRAACPVGQLRRRARSSHDRRPAARRRRPVIGVPGLRGHEDLRRRPVPAPLPAGRRLPEPLGVLRRPARTHRARPRPRGPRPQSAQRLRPPAQSPPSGVCPAPLPEHRDAPASVCRRTRGAPQSAGVPPRPGLPRPPRRRRGSRPP
jgi:hypothetical protein